jgi:hypothetical protein
MISMTVPRDGTVPLVSPAVAVAIIVITTVACLVGGAVSLFRESRKRTRDERSRSDAS